MVAGLGRSGRQARTGHCKWNRQKSKQRHNGCEQFYLPAYDVRASFGRLDAAKQGLQQGAEELVAQLR